MKKHYRILVGTEEIAGYYHNLCEGFKQLGVTHDLVIYRPHPFRYGDETQHPLLLRLARWFNQFRGKPNRSVAVRVIFALLGEILQGLWALHAILRYDVFIFGFGSSLLRENIDLPILRKLGKTVVSNLAHGSEARPAFIGWVFQSQDGVSVAVDFLFSAAHRSKKRLVKHERYSNIVVGAPFSTTQFASFRMINAFALGLPIQVKGADENVTPDIKMSASNTDARTIRILHSPSHPAAKGSPLIIQAIENLRQRGYVIEFTLIHGRPNKDVLAEIQRCDFVVDQIYSDTPMAGFATESAWFGKPAVVGGYGLDRLKQFVPEGMWPPSKTCHPDQIEQAIEEMIVDIEQRERLGREAQAFVRSKWNAAEVARRYLCLIEGNIPEEWWLNPKDVVYLEGGGQSMSKSQQTIRDLVAAYGVKSLQLSHRPDLQTAFLEFAQIRQAD
jgi:hypothetical protein